MDRYSFLHSNKPVIFLKFRIEIGIYDAILLRLD